MNDARQRRLAEAVFVASFELYSAAPDEYLARKELRDDVARALSRLSERQREVIRLRFGIGETSDHTLRGIAERLGITQERVRQIEKRALSKLGRQPSYGILSAHRSLAEQSRDVTTNTEAPPSSGATARRVTPLSARVPVLTYAEREASWTRIRKVMAVANVVLGDVRVPARLFPSGGAQILHGAYAKRQLYIAAPPTGPLEFLRVEDGNDLDEGPTDLDGVSSLVAWLTAASNNQISHHTDLTD